MMSLHSKQKESEAGNEKKVEELKLPRVALPSLRLPLCPGIKLQFDRLEQVLAGKSLSRVSGKRKSTE